MKVVKTVKGTTITSGLPAVSADPRDLGTRTFLSPSEISRWGKNQKGVEASKGKNSTITPDNSNLKFPTPTPIPPIHGLFKRFQWKNPLLRRAMLSA
ncbi:MAG: hypothetical protein H0A76_05780 [Candidatus Thiodubiliella endoseptemdiera]|uniref:Uncharacterized protein n=1 Tax=Candidatus Thiodubiliella endoseptemdiera TaxID=2738886 RepID=A0A853F1Q2_9GAMM|nr:hypothetical protein [Candidatus Thiodubiliella endoseptemdiera]